MNIRDDIYNELQRRYVPADGIIERVDEFPEDQGNWTDIHFWRDEALEVISLEGSVFDLLIAEEAAGEGRVGVSEKLDHPFAPWSPKYVSCGHMVISGANPFFPEGSPMECGLPIEDHETVSIRAYELAREALVEGGLL